jgi:2'-5' RNA ligase
MRLNSAILEQKSRIPYEVISMAKIAVDAVLLPSEEMTQRTIEANMVLLKQYDDKIILDEKNCLPHISLAMGCINERDIVDIGKILHTIAEKYTLGKLSIIGINITTNTNGENVSSFQINRTKILQSLHEEVMRNLATYFKYDVTADMVLSPLKASESTLQWIKNYPKKSSFENFFPHITIGYGQISDLSFPIEFSVTKLALCHMGNHCTCRKILASAELTI